MDWNNHLEMEKENSFGSSEATILVNESGVISFANQQVYENFGYLNHELIGEKAFESYARSKSSGKWGRGNNPPVRNPQGWTYFFTFFQGKCLFCLKKRSIT